MKKEQMETLLITLLDCGYADLNILDGCEYDIADLIDYCREDLGYEKIDINNLAYAMFEFGKRDIEKFISNRIDELEEQDELTDEEETEVEELKSLDIFEDVESFHNFIDTSIYFSASNGKKEIYEKYLQEALNYFENMTGFQIG